MKYPLCPKLLCVLIKILLQHQPCLRIALLIGRLATVSSNSTGRWRMVPFPNPWYRGTRCGRDVTFEILIPERLNPKLWNESPCDRSPSCGRLGTKTWCSSSRVVQNLHGCVVTGPWL